MKVDGFYREDGLIERLYGKVYWGVEGVFVVHIWEVEGWNVGGKSWKVEVVGEWVEGMLGINIDDEMWVRKDVVDVFWMGVDGGGIVGCLFEEF